MSTHQRWPKPSSCAETSSSSVTIYNSAATAHEGVTIARVTTAHTTFKGLSPAACPPYPRFVDPKIDNIQSRSFEVTAVLCMHEQGNGYLQ